jgi:hypothetical protein
MTPRSRSKTRLALPGGHLIYERATKRRQTLRGLHRAAAIHGINQQAKRYALKVAPDY